MLDISTAHAIGKELNARERVFIFYNFLDISRRPQIYTQREHLRSPEPQAGFKSRMIKRPGTLTASI